VAAATSQAAASSSSCRQTGTLYPADGSEGQCSWTGRGLAPGNGLGAKPPRSRSSNQENPAPDPRAQAQHQPRKVFGDTAAAGDASPLKKNRWAGEQRQRAAARIAAADPQPAAALIAEVFVSGDPSRLAPAGIHSGAIPSSVLGHPLRRPLLKSPPQQHRGGRQSAAQARCWAAKGENKTAKGGGRGQPRATNASHAAYPHCSVGVMGAAAVNQ